MGEDGLSLSVASSQMQSSLRVFLKKIYNQVLCSDLPVACAFVSSRLKGNGQPALSCAKACWALHSHLHPPLLP